MSLVRSLARRYSYRGEQLEDLVQIGAIGLIKAIDRFDLERGVELTTYATPNIIGEIKRHFRDKGWAVRVPRGLQELNVQLSRLVEQLTVQLGRSPTIPELAKAAGVEEEQVLEALESGRAYTSLSLSVGGGGGDDDDLDPLESLGTDGAPVRGLGGSRRARAGLQGARRARAEDPPAPLLRRPDAVADRAAGRDLADARLPPDPALAREDPRDDRRGRGVPGPLAVVGREDTGRATVRRVSGSAGLVEQHHEVFHLLGPNREPGCANGLEAEAFVETDGAFVLVPHRQEDSGGVSEAWMVQSSFQQRPAETASLEGRFDVEPVEALITRPNIDLRDGDLAELDVSNQPTILVGNEDGLLA